MMTYATIEEAWGTGAKESFVNKANVETLRRFTHPSTMPRGLLAPSDDRAPEDTDDATAKAVAAVFDKHGLGGVIRLLPRPCVAQLMQAVRRQCGGWLSIEDLVGCVLVAVIAYVALDAGLRLAHGQK
jgi:hypothetical protein